MQVQTDQPINTLRFNWRFAAGGEGFLRVFVNEHTVRKIDQRHVPAVSSEPESIYLRELAPGTHKIAFRLDGYGTNPSSVELTGIELGWKTSVLEDSVLTVSRAGTGSGTITSTPAGIDCGATCSASFDSGTSVTLTATPATGSTFTGWSPASCGSSFTLTVDTTCTATFNLTNRPPVANAGPDQTVECTGSSGASVRLDGSGSSDPDGDPLTFTWTGPFGTQLGKTIQPTIPLGAYDINLAVADGKGGTANDTVNVTVRDTTPPTLSVALSPNSLWPPNHKMVTITATVRASDICDPNPKVTLVSITSNEPDNGLGDGDTANDIQNAAFGTDDRSFALRAERAGAGTGRIYTVTYQAKDRAGNASTATAQVVVPHDQGK